MLKFVDGESYDAIISKCFEVMMRSQLRTTKQCVAELLSQIQTEDLSLKSIRIIKHDCKQDYNEFLGSYTI